MVCSVGRSVFVETTTGAGGRRIPGCARAGLGRQSRLGPDPPSELLLRSWTQTSIHMSYRALGVDPSSGRDWSLAGGQASQTRIPTSPVDLTLEPLARLIETECRAKLDSPNLTISFRSLRSADYATLARAFRSMKDAGVQVGEIARILDINLGIERRRRRWRMLRKRKNQKVQTGDGSTDEAAASFWNIW